MIAVSFLSVFLFMIKILIFQSVSSTVSEGNTLRKCKNKNNHIFFVFFKFSFIFFRLERKQFNKILLESWNSLQSCLSVLRTRNYCEQQFSICFECKVKSCEITEIFVNEKKYSKIKKTEKIKNLRITEIVKK